MTKAITWAVLIFAVIILLTTTLRNDNEEVVQEGVDTTTQEEMFTETDTTANVAPVEQLEVSFVEEAIVGTWQSTLDPKAIDILNADGSMTSLYDGEEVATGEWSVYADADAEYDPSSTFLKISTDSLALDYAVIMLTDDLLQINYLERGNTLEYQRVTE